MRIVAALLALTTIVAAAHAQWIKRAVNTTASFRGLAVVNKNVVWASGTGGTVVRTTDGGKTWKVMVVPGAEKLDFRDIEAFDAKTAYILSIGNGDSSRIYKTTDGGEKWQLQFTNTDQKAFYDAIACWDRSNCIAMSDPVDGHYRLISTSDGGANWKTLVTNGMPAAKDGEAAFAASGTCLITQGKTTAFLVSGGTDARVFKSGDHGRTWTVTDTPMVKGTAGSGIFSIAMFNDRTGVIVGGNYEKPGESKDNLAFTDDSGRTWSLGKGLGGYRSGVTYAEGAVIAVGTSGSDISWDRGKTWHVLGKEDLNAVQAKGRIVWAVGPKGTVLRHSIVDILSLIKTNRV